MLPILKTTGEPTTADLLRLFQQTSRAWAGQLVEPRQLDVATVYANPALPRVAHANQSRDAALPPGTTPAEAVAEVDAAFAESGGRCARWSLNASAPAGQTSPLVEHFRSLGWHELRLDVLYRPKVTRLADERAVAGVRVIPARAGFAAARALYAEAARGDARDAAAVEQWADAELLRLDDPRYDALLALHDGRPVGGVGVLAAGELGRIERLFVVPAFRRRGLGQLLLGRAMEVCARSLFRHVFLQVEAGNNASALLTGAGLTKIGSVTEWETGETHSTGGRGDEARGAVPV